jgi:hypothetical protein
MKKKNKIKLKFIKGKRYKNVDNGEILWYNKKYKQKDGSYTYIFIDTYNNNRYYNNNEIENGTIISTKDKTDYEKKYDEFWKNIVEKKSKLNKDAVMRELSDFSKIIDNCSCIYGSVTNGRISKPLTDWKIVETEYEDILSEDYFDKYATKVDVKNIIKECKTIKEIKKELIEYFEIDIDEDKEE